MSGFFEELKRRKVFRVAIAYVVGSWALAQGLSQVLPVFDIPNSVIRGVIGLMLVGFPAALVLAWIFDITPSGIQRTSKVEAEPQLKSRRRRNVVLLAASGAAPSGVPASSPYGATTMRIERQVRRSGPSDRRRAHRPARSAGQVDAELGRRLDGLVVLAGGGGCAEIAGGEFA